MKKIYKTACFFSLIVLSFLPVSQAQSQNSCIIVHALNPQGVEIASIEGVGPDSVKIYDGESLIGYGAYNNETHNKPIAIPEGTHVIKAVFEGAELTQDIILQQGETKVIVFTFDYQKRLDAIGNYNLSYFESSVRICTDQWWSNWEWTKEEWMQKLLDIKNTAPCYEQFSWVNEHSSIIWQGLWHYWGDMVEYSGQDLCVHVYKIDQGHFPVNCIPEHIKVEIGCYRDGWVFDQWLKELQLSVNDWSAVWPRQTQEAYKYGQPPFALTVPYAPVVTCKYGFDKSVYVLDDATFYPQGGEGSSFSVRQGTKVNWQLTAYGWILEPYDLTGTGIKCEVSQSPLASFSYSPKNPNPGQEITFDASSSSDPAGTILKYEWNLGDGSIAQGLQITHVYQETGKYTVTLSVTDDKGLTNTNESILTVGQPTLEVFDASDFSAGRDVTTDIEQIVSTVKSGQATAVEGVATEGVARLLLAVDVPQPGSVKFSLEGGTGNPKEDGVLRVLGGFQEGNILDVNTVTTTEGEKAFCIYQAPEDFVRKSIDNDNDGKPDDQTISERAISLKVEYNNGTPIEKQIKLVRPPLVLIHGLWTGPEMWSENDFLFNLISHVPGIHVFMIDYHERNASHFADNKDVPYSCGGDNNLIKTRKTYKE
ncbi:PKD domain-containing protein, partial [bacterium]